MYKNYVIFSFQKQVCSFLNVLVVNLQGINNTVQFNETVGTVARHNPVGGGEGVL